MPRLLAIDYGLKRVGLAVSDPLQIIATALETVPNDKIWDYLKSYIAQEEVEAFILGLPRNLEGKDTDASAPVREFSKKMAEQFPSIPVFFHDERFTSKIALDTMIQGGTSKKYRRNKANLDKISAVIILQSYMQSQG